MRRRPWIVIVALLLIGLAAPASPAAAAVTPVSKVTFQPAGSTVPAGYSADTGAPFDAARGYGWVQRGTSTPLDLTRNTRDRARPGVDARLNTLIHLQYGDVGGTAGVLTEGAWEYAVANGAYQVTVSVGDQPAYDSRHTVRVEGVVAVDGFVSTAAAEFRAATVTVAVTDGRLTVDALGGTNTKLNYVDLSRVTADFAPLKVDFSDAATAPATGYVHDSGGAYTAARGYGWVDLGERTPVDLTGNGRNRNPAAGQADARLATFVHAQLPAGSAGVATPGAWEAAVPAGLYTVTVAVGDAGTAVDSTNWVSIEDQNAIAAFTPTASVKFATATRTVRVTDGKLTISPAGGSNTKVAYADITAVAGDAAIPAVRTSTPANGATGVSLTGSIVEDLVLPNGGVRAASLTGSTVTLTRLSDGGAVPATTITSGGGDVINLSPTGPLAPLTTYRFTVTSGVTDVTGQPFAPYSMVFTTGSGSPTGGTVAFDKTVGVATGASFTTVVKGPDGRLYAGTLDGRIFRFPINAGGTSAARRSSTPSAAMPPPSVCRAPRPAPSSAWPSTPRRRRPRRSCGSPTTTSTWARSTCPTGPAGSAASAGPTWARTRRWW